MKKTLHLLAFLLISTSFAQAQYITAKDDAGNYSQSDFVAQGNLGFGFGNWYTNNDNGGYFRASASEQGVNSGQIDVSGNSFGIWASGFSDVGRMLPTALPDGATLSFNLAYQWDNGNRGFSLYTSESAEIFNFNINSGGYSWTGDGSAASTPWSGQREFGVAMAFTFSRNGNNISYSFSSIAGGGPTGSGTLNNVNFAHFKFYVSGAGGGSGANMYFNSPKIEYADPAKVPATSHVQINGNLTLAANLSCTNLTIPSGSSLTINQSNNGSLIYTGTLSGDVTVQRTLTGANQYHFISAPVAGELVGDVFDPAFYDDIYLRRYDEPSGNWVNLTTADAMSAGHGYSFISDEMPVTATFTGALSNSSLDVDLSVSNPSGNTNYQFWNLLGNPYTSAIDWDLLDIFGAEGSVYVWNPASGNYISWNGSSGALTDGIIAPQQGFFVKAEGIVKVGPRVTFTPESRLHSSAAFYKNSSVAALEISVSNDVNTYSDKTYVQLNPLADASFDSQFDSRKLDGETDAPELYTIAGDTRLSINVLPSVEESMALPLYLKPGITGNFVIEASGAQSLNSLVLLHDLSTGAMIDLNNEPYYEFSAQAGDEHHRFNLIFSSVGVKSPEASKIFAYYDGAGIYVNNSNSNAAVLDVFSMSGQLLYNSKMAPSSVQMVNAGLRPGIYLLRLATDAGTYTQKIVVR